MCVYDNHILSQSPLSRASRSFTGPIAEGTKGSICPFAKPARNDQYLRRADLERNALVASLRSERGPHHGANRRASKLGLFQCFLVLGGLVARAEDLIQFASFNVAR
jgi:hypothetical protein